MSTFFFTLFLLVDQLASQPASTSSASPTSAAPQRAFRGLPEEAPPEVAITPAPPVRGLGSKQSFWRIDLGWRGGAMNSSSYAPYAVNNAITQGSVGLSRTVFSASRFSLAAGLVWDASAQTETTRNSEVSLVAQRFAATIEGRVHVLPWLYVFAKAAPGAVWAQSTIHDESLFAPLSGEKWGASFDASGGLSVLLLPHRDSARARWWLTFEGGYGWVQSLPFTLKPQASAIDSAHVAALHLPGLSLNGALYRVTTGISF